MTPQAKRWLVVDAQSDASELFMMSVAPDSSSVERYAAKMALEALARMKFPTTPARDADGLFTREVVIEKLQARAVDMRLDAKMRRGAQEALRMLALEAPPVPNRYAAELSVAHLTQHASGLDPATLARLDRAQGIAPRSTPQLSSLSASGFAIGEGGLPDSDTAKEWLKRIDDASQPIQRSTPQGPVENGLSEADRRRFAKLDRDFDIDQPKTAVESTSRGLSMGFSTQAQALAHRERLRKEGVL